MSTTIHPTAIIEPGATLGQRVSIGAYAFVGANTIIGDECIIHHHATVDGKTTLGSNNQIFPYAFIGGPTHDVKMEGTSGYVKIGNHNTFREYVTVHAATKNDATTLIGNNNLILSYSHVAHDCTIGNYLIMSSHAALGGHSVVEDYVNIGWGVGVHQFCRIGAHAMVGATSKLVQDAPSFMITDGNPAQVRTINKVGLERHGFSKEDIYLAKQLFKIIFHGKLNRSQALEKIEQLSYNNHPITQQLIHFIRTSQRGVV